MICASRRTSSSTCAQHTHCWRSIERSCVSQHGTTTGVPRPFSTRPVTIIHFPNLKLIDFSSVISVLCLITFLNRFLNYKHFFAYSILFICCSTVLNLFAEMLYRTDFFSGLGWMLTRDLWLELEPKWPIGFVSTLNILSIVLKEFMHLLD